ncbi:MAG: four helix bundle protein [Bacteroidales bacterium]|nr:four helix bundle protein [Bacteroidales bacterium]MDZ4204350.1 four helix bundle protein [Bacteroidales bacterium]
MVEKENIILTKTFNFALVVIEVCRWLQTEKKECVISNQLINSGTSIGANIREAQEAESKADFIHKCSIANKESRETNYWIDLLVASKLLDGFNKTETLVSESLEIKMILT